MSDSTDRRRGIDGGEAAERDDVLEARCVRLRAQRDEARARANEILLRWAVNIDGRVTDLEVRNEIGGADGEAATDVEDAEPHGGAQDQLTDGERATLRALRALGDHSSSREIAEDVDGTLQSVRSWLGKLVQEDHIRAQPDPSDGRRKLYSPLDRDGQPDREHADDERAGTEETADERTDDEGTHEQFEDGSDDERTDDEGTDEQFDGTDGPVHIASHGGSPSQVFHARPDCPQLKKSSDSVEKDRSVVPHHRPCANCVPDGLETGLVAIAKGSETTTYHERADCPKLGAANDVAIQERERVPNYDPCADCVRRDEDPSTDDEDDAGHDENPVKDDTENDADTDEGDSEDTDGPTAAKICAQNDLRRGAVVEALDRATAIYHVQRDLALTRDETEALLQTLGVFETLDGGGLVTPERAKAVALEHLPSTRQLQSDRRDRRD